MAKKKQKEPETPERLAQVRRHCRGPYNENPGEVLKRLERAKHVRREQIAKAVEKAVKGLSAEEATTGRIVGALVDTDPDSARDLHRMAYAGCGADLNPVIAELPEDGESHAFECPACGASHHATRVPVEEGT